MKWEHTKHRVGEPFGDRQVTIYSTRVPNGLASFAFTLLERFSIIAGEPDGEDAAGRQKLKLPDASVLAKRAFDIAEAAFAECEARGHMMELPDLNEINAKPVKEPA